MMAAGSRWSSQRLGYRLQAVPQRLKHQTAHPAPRALCPGPTTAETARAGCEISRSRSLRPDSSPSGVMAWVLEPVRQPNDGEHNDSVEQSVVRSRFLGGVRWSERQHLG
jgi:hypothetical protein